MTDDGLRSPSPDLDDEDSLFGSPPPSPSASSAARADREKSPALALPISGSGASRFSTSTATGLQNVGTIALPGSHHDIELPMTPIALSLNHNVVTRPPALPGTQNKTSNGPPFVGSIGCSSSNSAHQRGSLTAGGNAAPSAKSRPKSKKTHRSTRSSKESTPQPRVEFDLPDPSGPLPAHFLRNQDKLLGVAGLVGGVKPAAITHVRGASASNPIIVDDDEDAPKLGRRPVQVKELFPPTKIDTALLEAPSNEEIVSVLIRQKDIFPVLQSILKLIAPQNAHHQRYPFSQTNNRASSSSQQPPLKKRKLNRVPAGAADWDVPYPFAQGEGPEEYQQTWERERSKQLITQLVKLIKTAAVKAATKKYVQKANQMREEEEERRKENEFLYGEPPPSTPAEPMMNTTHGAYNISSLPSNIPTPLPFPSQTLPSVTAPHTSSAAFDHLISSLVAAQPHDPPTSSSNSENAPESATPDPLTSQPQGPIDQSLFDSWMDILQAFPVQFDNGSTFGSSQLTVNTSFDMNFNTGMESQDFGLSGLDPFGLPASTPVSASESTTPFAETTPVVPSADELKAMVSTMGDISTPCPVSPPTISDIPMNVDSSSIGDHLIDPQLMMLSTQIEHGINTLAGANNQPGTDNLPTPTSMDVDRLSPLTSTAASSSGGTGPTTPASAAWDFAMPDFMNSLGNNDAMMVDEGSGAGVGDLSAFGMDMGTHTSNGMVNPSLGKIDKGKGKEIVPASSFSDIRHLDVTTSTSGSTTPVTVQHPPPSLEDSLFQSLFRAQPSQFTPTVPLPTSRNITQPLQSSLPFIPIPTVGLTSSEYTLDRKVKREDILKRAKQKREKLQEELNKVKMQLWETTVEQAGLVSLQRKVDEWSKQPPRSTDDFSCDMQPSNNNPRGEVSQVDASDARTLMT